MILVLDNKFKPIIAITMGDAAGVGPEIINKALVVKDVYNLCNPLVIGDLSMLQDALKVADVELKFNPINDVTDAQFRYGIVDVIDLKNIEIDNLTMGKPQKMAGKASVEYVEKAVLEYAPNHICNFLFKLGQKYNAFYNAHRILGSNLANFRLALTAATGQVLKNGLALLGIGTPCKM